MPGGRRENQLQGKENFDASKILLQGSSPDEVALVSYSNSIHMVLMERDRTYIQIQNC